MRQIENLLIEPSNSPADTMGDPRESNSERDRVRRKNKRIGETEQESCGEKFRKREKESQKARAKESESESKRVRKR